MSLFLFGWTPYIYLWLYSPFVGPWPLFSFLISYIVGKSPWTGDQPVARPLLARRTTQNQNKRTQTSMPWVGSEPTIPVRERSKTVHALDRAATVIGYSWIMGNVNYTCVKRHFYKNLSLKTEDTCKSIFRRLIPIKGMIRIKSCSNSITAFRAAILYPILLKPQEQFGPCYLRKNGHNRTHNLFLKIVSEMCKQKEMI
jgi:hypothetical protein